MLERNFHDENAWRINAKASKLEGLAEGRSLERQEAIARAVATAKSSNQPKEDAVKAISMVFGLSSEDAEKAVDELW